MKKEIPNHVVEKRLELIWAIALQGYSLTEIAYMFGMPRSTVHKYVAKMPDGWQSKWVKQV